MVEKGKSCSRAWKFLYCAHVLMTCEVIPSVALGVAASKRAGLVAGTFCSDWAIGSASTRVCFSICGLRPAVSWCALEAVLGVLTMLELKSGEDHARSHRGWPALLARPR